MSDCDDVRSRLERLELVVDSISAFIAYVDKRKHYIYMNRAYDDWFGIGPEDRGKHARQVLDAKTYACARPYMEQALAGTKATYENEMRKPGAVKYVLTNYIPDKAEDGTVRGFIVVGSDITIRHKAELQLQASEERFRFMAESMPQKIFTVQPDRQPAYFNPQWEKFIDVSSIQPTGKRYDYKPITSIVHPDDLPGLVKTWRAAFRNKKGAEYEFRLRERDGTYRWQFGRMHPMRNDDGEIRLWIGSVTDIDDMKRSLLRRHELEIEAAALSEQSAQLLVLNQAKDEFISLASHQLRTPATGVKQFLAMLLEGYAGPLSDEQRAFAETAFQSNERQINIVNDLLQVARIDAGKITLRPVKTDLVKLAKNVLNEHASQFRERQQEVVVTSALEKLYIKVDGDRMRMVFDNIVDNASKYTPPGKKIRVSLAERAGKAVVKVADQGIGISAQDINKIFQKFTRLENPHAKGVEGSGLGLYWAKKIVDLHGGKISVRSSDGKGTVFTITLPM